VNRRGGLAAAIGVLAVAVAGCDSGTPAKPPGPPLHVAIQAGDLAAVRCLIAEGADLDFRDDEYGTPLAGAIVCDRPEILHLLVEGGADVNGKSRNEWRPLHYAALMGRPEMAQYLIDHGADVRAPNIEGYTALEWGRKAQYLFRDEAPENDRQRFADVLALLERAEAALPPPEEPGPDEPPPDEGPSAESAPPEAPAGRIAPLPAAPKG
jgi:hypothetical protein